MEVNPTESDHYQTRRNPDKTIRPARFRQSPGGSLMYCKICLEAPCRCSYRSDLFGVCLNCPLDNKGSCGSCSAISAASLDRSTSTVTVTGDPSTRATETLEKDEGSVYNGRTAGYLKEIFLKPSTTTAMRTPGAEESTVYNGKIGRSLIVGHQSGTNPTAIAASSSAHVRNENEAIFDESIYSHRGGLISFGKLPSSSASSPPIHMLGSATTKATKEGVPMTRKRTDRLKRSWRGDIVTEDASDLPPEKDVRFGPAAVVVSKSVPEHSLQTVLFNEAVMAALPSNSLHKRRKRETMSIRVRDVNSEESGLPPDGYRWWKYGQKDIKGSPYPRNYYKCKTLSHCDAKKHVMRAVDEPSMLEITYKGEHSHAPPLELNDAVGATATASASASASASAAAAAADNDIVAAAAPQEEPTSAKPAHFIEYL